MAGELCAPGCGWCGRCDAEPDDVLCDDCGQPNCLGDCQQPLDGNQDDHGTSEEAA
jgi:hypothetical protein